ncbi:hypothetical protein PCE31106_00103 [Pandoraea cepalis]|uniref:Uncharacterized protein n=1 Tax=Pandoraea cepalis TaxID=2508294 RepID=A0A5E4RCY3_9BURK|nr:hypothetical protein [Pandoraea cepalis]VVD61160.1 hypothetical protein PCE31106_00103 [Pandoraea cepalis]
MTYFYINPLYINDPDEQAALDRALAVLAGLPLGYLDTLIAAHDTYAATMDQWCDDWRDENADRLDAFDTPEPEDQPEYQVACEAERRNVADEFHVTVEQLKHAAVIAELGSGGLAELRERNELFWSIAEAAGMTID